jgi:ankyrin repeat protein
MKYLKATCVAGAVLIGMILLLPVRNPGSGFTREPQRATSEMEMKSFTSNLIAYAEDHCDELPLSISDLSGESFGKYGLGENLYAKGNHVQSYAPVDFAPSPLIAEVFSHHEYIVTKDRRHLLVFERPGLWDDHTVAYFDLNLTGRWTHPTADGFDEIKFTRVSEQQFAQYIANIAAAAQNPSQADELVMAAENGDSKKVEEMLDHGGAVNDEGIEGWTPLTAAAQEDQLEMVELLISRGASINLEDDYGVGRTALMRASALGHAAIVDSLLAHGADVGMKRAGGNNALMDALPYPAIVLKLINAGANTNEEIEKERSPLIAACSEGYAETARLLIEHGADLNRDGLDALNSAARNGKTDVLDVLLSKGISVDKKLLGECLSDAYPYPQALQRLIAAGADPNAKCGCPGGRTALMIAALNDCSDSVAVLIAAGADLNARDDNGYTVLDLTLADTTSDWLLPFERDQTLGIVDILRKAGAKQSGLRVEWPEP